MKLNSQRKAWKAVLGHLFSHRKEVILLSILGLVSALANGFVPFITGRFFDSIINFSATVYSRPAWQFYIIVWLTIQVAANVVDWISGKREKVMGVLVESHYMSKSYQRLLKMPVAFFKD